MATSEHPVVFFESTHRIIKCLQELQKLIPERQLIVARELTKVFETVYRGRAGEVLLAIQKTSSKGEFVVIVKN